jgi:hypothetical protein
MGRDVKRKKSDARRAIWPLERGGIEIALFIERRRQGGRIARGLETWRPVASMQSSDAPLPFEIDATFTAEHSAGIMAVHLELKVT